MCRKEMRDTVVEEVYAHLRGAVVNSIRLLYDFGDTGLEIVGAFTVTDGDTGNEFIVYDDGSVAYAGAPISEVRGIGNRGIAAICDVVRAVKV